ncbi:MAG: hypothetical protein COB88_10455 [Flavobacteriales bacterium]|nr:MAG: hypothetical protein COB88_10455 [Flavobacteriales bacterium]
MAQVSDEWILPLSGDTLHCTVMWGNEQMLRVVPSGGDTLIIMSGEILHYYNDGEQFGHEVVDTICDYESFEINDYLDSKHNLKTIITKGTPLYGKLGSSTMFHASIMGRAGVIVLRIRTPKLYCIERFSKLELMMIDSSIILQAAGHSPHVGLNDSLQLMPMMYSLKKPQSDYLLLNKIVRIRIETNLGHIEQNIADEAAIRFQHELWCIQEQQISNRE